MKGHIRKRGEGTYAIVLDARDPATGTRRRVWRSFRGTRRQAQDECARLITELQGGGAVDPSRITVAEYLDRFEADWCSMHLTPASAERYASSLLHVRRSRLSDRRLQALRPSDVAGLYSSLARDTGLSAKTIRLIHAVLSRALRQARVWGLLRDVATETARPPKAEEYEAKILQPAEARALLDHLRGDRLYLLVSFLLATGCRRNEALAVRWRDLDLEVGKVSITQAIEGHSDRVKGPKTKHGRRVITLPAGTISELRQHRTAQRERWFAAGRGRVPDDARVFDDLSPNIATKAFRAVAKRLGLDGISLHSLRHSHASALLAGGADVLTVSRRLGHASANITLSTYAHLVGGSDDRAAGIADAAFKSEKKW